MLSARWNQLKCARQTSKLDFSSCWQVLLTKRKVVCVFQQEHIDHAAVEVVLQCLERSISKLEAETRCLHEWRKETISARDSVHWHRPWHQTNGRPGRWCAVPQSRLSSNLLWISTWRGWTVHREPIIIHAACHWTDPKFGLGAHAEMECELLPSSDLQLPWYLPTTDRS